MSTFKKEISIYRFKKKKALKQALCLLFISIFLLNFLFTNNNQNSNKNSNNNNSFLETNFGDEQNDLPKISFDEDDYKDPFTENFSKMWDFFGNTFKSNYKVGPGEYIPLYVNASDENGVIIDNTTLSGDNLLLYNTLVKGVQELEGTYDAEDTFNAYLDLKDTSLWRDESDGYGFVQSINGSTGQIINRNRTLVDNLESIFLLIDNRYDNDFAVRTEISSMFYLINSSEFWDVTNNGFYEFNSSTYYDKYMKSNLYAVLACLKVFQDGDGVAQRALELGKLNMETLVNKTWDNDDKGFYYHTRRDWQHSIISDENKYLDVNALGIMALLEYWIMDGMRPSSDYLKNATALYNIINRDSGAGANGGLWNSASNLYEYYRLWDWNPSSVPSSEKFDLESNALMLQAILRLFEVTGNITYYEKAFTLFESIKKYFYNGNLNANKMAHGINNPNVGLKSNLKLCEAYLVAKDIYRSTVLDVSNNISGKTDFIINQESLNLTCDYAFKKNINFYDPVDVSGVNTTIYNNITDASITYILRYSNKTQIMIKQESINTNVTNFIYPINNSLPFENGYTLLIVVNSSTFGMTNATFTFNVISGLEFLSVDGLDDSLYQSITTNITIRIFSNYNYNLTVNVSLHCSEIDELKTNNHTYLRNINFVNNSETSIYLNITIKNDATQGKTILTFLFNNGSILYLEYDKEIEIKNALTYSNLIYDQKVVAGSFILVLLTFKNALNDTQEFNISFIGDYVKFPKREISLQANLDEITLSFIIFFESIINVETTEVEMIISKNYKSLYTEVMTVEIVPKFEIISIEFPEKVTQGVTTHIIIFIQNNQKSSEEFTLIIDDKEITTEIDELISGENRIEQEFLSAWNPYEFGIKSHTIEIEDESGDVMVTDYFECEIQLSSFNLIVFYVFPISLAIGIILYYKNKDIKNKLLRR